MEPKNDSDLVYGLIGAVSAIILIVVLIVGIFFIRKKKQTSHLAFIDNDSETPSHNEARNPEFFDGNTESENNGRQGFEPGCFQRFTIYCRSCNMMINRRHEQNAQVLQLNCFASGGNSGNDDHQRMLKTGEEHEISGDNDNLQETLETEGGK